jgi:hypothetical protein
MQIKIFSKTKNETNGNGKGKKDDMKLRKIKLPERAEIEN